MQHWQNNTTEERRSRPTRSKTYPGATVSTTNPTCTGLASNPGLRGERPVTNRLSHDMALNTDGCSKVTLRVIN
jgi:hypothetical protein